MSNSVWEEMVQRAIRLDRRQARLFLCACVRRLRRAEQTSFREAIELAERYVEGQATTDAVRSMRFTYRYRFTHPAWILLWPDDNDPLEMVQRGLVWLEDYDRSPQERQARLHLLADLLPPSSLRPDPAWLTWADGTIPRLATALYHERNYEDLPILADALEEAGCTEDIWLAHARVPRLHCHGCWLLEALRRP
ncbi:MAG: hypothetical protein SNJ75_03620 [Gemmataceae bacterium]